MQRCRKITKLISVFQITVGTEKIQLECLLFIYVLPLFVCCTAASTVKDKVHFVYFSALHQLQKKTGNQKIE